MGNRASETNPTPHRHPAADRLSFRKHSLFNPTVTAMRSGMPHDTRMNGCDLSHLLPIQRALCWVRAKDGRSFKDGWEGRYRARDDVKFLYNARCKVCLHSAPPATPLARQTVAICNTYFAVQ